MERKGRLQTGLPEPNFVIHHSRRTKPAYEYMSQTDPKKGRKNFRGPDGKVMTHSSNVLISPQGKIEYQKIK